MDSSGSVNERFPPMPLLRVFLGVVAGILLYNVVGQADSNFAFLVAPAILLLCIIAAAAAKRLRGVVFFASALIGWLAAWCAQPRIFDAPPLEGTVYEGVVTQVNYGATPWMQIKVEGEVVGDSVVATQPFNLCDYGEIGATEPGDRVRVTGDYALPYAETDLPMENDLRGMYEARGVSLVCFSHNNILCEVGRSGNPIYAFARWRFKLANYFITGNLTPQAAAFYAAIVTGDTSMLEAADRARFASAGVAHVLALSGAHLAIIIVIINMLLIPLTLSGGYVRRWWVALAVLWFYAFLTGLSPSVFRSAIMVTAVVASIILDRPTASLNSLCGAAAIIVFCNPASLWMPGFQLSFTATLFIILLSNRLNPFNHKQTLRHRFWGYIIVTLSATLGTLPLVAWHFHQVPMYFLPANLVAVFVLPVAISIGLIYLGLSALGATTVWLGWCMNWAYRGFDCVVSWVAALPGAAITEIYFSAWMLVPAYLALGALVLWVWRRRAVYGVATLALTLFTAGSFALMRPQYADNDVFIISKHGYTNLISHRGDSLTIFTTRHPVSHSADSAIWRNKYRDFLGSRHIRYFAVKPASDAGIIRCGTESYKFAIDTTAIGKHSTHCIVTRAALGDKPNPMVLFGKTDVDTLYISPADTILIAADITRGALTSLQDLLTRAKVPYRGASTRNSR